MSTQISLRISDETAALIQARADLLTGGNFSAMTRWGLDEAFMRQEFDYYVKRDAIEAHLRAKDAEKGGE